MESGEAQNFCTHCGHVLTADQRFCPECGTRVPGRNPEAVQQEKADIKYGIGRQLVWAAALMLIYSVPFLVVGIYVALSAESMTDMMFDDPTILSYIEQYGFTRQDVLDYFEVASIAYIISSVCGIVSAYLCYTKQHFWPALILCVVSVMTGVAGFVALFMGLFAFWLILSGKMGFKEYESELDSELSKIV